MFGTYRTLLALMVVASHIGGVPIIGSYAVFGFYCLSGYLMTLIMQKTYGYTYQGVKRYAINRFLRIFPIYWVSILFSSVIIVFLGDEYVREYHHAMFYPSDLYQVIGNLFIFFPQMEIPRLTPPAWALTVELFFYLLIGLGLSKTKERTVVWFFCSVIYHVFAVILGMDKYFSIAAASLPFSTGAIIFHFRHKVYRIFENIPLFKSEGVPIAVFSAAILNWFFGYIFGFSSVFFYVNYFLSSLVIVFLIDKKIILFINKEMDSKIGDFSYPVYLIHYQIGLVTIFLLGLFGISLKRPGLDLLFIGLPILFLFSWSIIILAERPIEMIRSKIKSMN